MPKQLAVLNIEDSESDSDLIARLFKKAGYEITFERIETSTQMQVELKKHAWDIIIADHSLPQFDSFAALALLHEEGMDIPFVVVSGLLGEETAVAIMKAGAQDYLLKNDLTRLMPAVERELEYAKLRREHRLAEEELYANERRFRVLIENSLDDISLLSADGTLLWESPSIIRNLSYAPNQFLNRNIFEIMHPDDLKQTQRLFAELIKKPASRQSATFRLRHSDGTWRWIEAVAANMLDEPSVQAILINYRDVTERKQAEEELRNSEQLFHELVDNIEEVFWITKPDTQKDVYVSPAHKKIWGRYLEDVDDFVESVFPADKTLVLSALEKQKHGEKTEIEYRIQHADGSIHWLWDRAFPIFDASDKLTRTVGIATDITGRKQADDALRTSEASLRGILQSTADGVLAVDTENHVLFTNQLFFDMWKIPEELNSSRDEAILLQYVLNEVLDPQGFLNKVQALYKSNEENLDIINFKDGRIFEHFSKPIIDRNAYAGRVWSFRDITERKHTEQVLIESETRFRQAIAAADAIPYNMTYAPDRYTFMGEGIKKLTGYSAAEITSPAMLDAFIVETTMMGSFKGRTLPEAVRLVREGKSGLLWQCEHRICTRSGEERWLADSSIQILGQNGIPTGSIGIFQDITERKLAEQSLHESELRYRSLFEESPIALWEEDFSAVKLRLNDLSNEGIKDFTAYFASHPQAILECISLVKIVDVNKAALKLFGANVKDDLLQNLSKFIDNDLLQSFQYELISIAQGKSHFEMETINQTLNGRQIILRLSLSVMPGCEDTYSTVIISMMDITSTVQVEKAIRESEKSLRESQIIAGLGSYTLDIPSEMWTSSDILNQIFGIDDLLTRSQEYWTMLIHPEWRQEMADYFANEVLENHIRFDKEYKIVRKNDGVERWVHGLGELEFNDQNQPVKMRGVIQDITERKQVEEKLQHTHQFLQSVQDALSAHIAILDDEGRIVQVNSAWRNFGTDNNLLSPNTCIGINYLEICDSALGLDAEEAPLIANAIRKTLSGEEEEERWIEYPGHSPTEQRWFIARITSFINNKRKWVIVSHENITARKQAEENLLESEQRYRALFEDMPVAIWEEDFSDTKKLLDSLKEQGVTDLRTYFEYHPDAFLQCATMIKVLDVNQATLKMYHADSKEYLYKSMDEELSESEVEQIEDTLIAIFEGRYSHNWEGRDETVAGKPIEVSLSWTVVPGHEADFSKVIVTTIDITERKQVQEALQKSEKRFRALIANTGDLIVVINKDGIIQFASPSSERILGYSPEEAIGINFTEWVHPDDLSKVQNSLASRLKETGTSVEGIKARGRHKDGSWRILDTIGTNLIHEPAIQGIVINIRDITERETAEESMRASEAQFRAIFEGAAIGIALVDPLGHPVKVNSALEEMLGYGALELRNMAFTEFTHPEDVAMDWDIWQELIAGKRDHYQIEKRFLHRDGHIIWVKLTTSAVVSEVDGKISFGVGMVEDITERKKVEVESKYQLSELEALYENGLAISRLLEPKRIAQRMVEVLDQKLDWHHVAIRTYDSSTDQIELLAFNAPGFDESQIIEQIERINQTINTPDKGLSGWVIRHEDVVRIGKLKDDPRYIETYPDINSGLYVPIKSGNQVMGSIAVESEQENAFTERDANTLTTLANQAAIAFVNARLYIWLQKELDERLRVEEQVRKLNVELEQRVAERTAQIEATKRRLELATHAGQIGVWEYIPRENKVIWDERMHLIHQIPTGEFDGTSEAWAKFIHPDDIEQSQVNRQLAVTKNLLMSNEHRIFWPDGSIRNVMSSAVMVYSPEGKPERMIGINMDITERKQIEQSLRESENYARLLFDAVPDPVSVTETDGLIVDVNKVFEEQYKLIRDDIRGKRISDLGIYPETELDKRDKYVSEILLEQNVEPIELEFYVPGDRIHILELHSYLLKINNRQLMLNISHDITLYKKAEETQRIAKSEMERALRIKNEFLANMSHELRTPLNSILGISESLEEQIAGTLNERQLRYVGIVKESGRHLLDLINDILDLSKIEAGRMELDIRSITVDKLCQSSLRMVKELAQKKSLNISYRLHEEVKIVLGDERRLKQSLVNLLSNAVKFTPTGNRIGLEVSGNAERNEVEFTVWDQGIGIAQKDIQHLFKPFVQLDGGLTREYQGTGLGLALVSQMAQLHGGRVHVESETGSGSRFTLTLPWLPNEQTSIARGTGQLPAPSQKSNMKRNGRILLVEDTDLVVQLISDYLRYRGYEILLAHNGAEGVKLAIEERPDLILMDVMMPVMNGLEAAQKIRADETLQKIPIIAMTALAMAGDSEKCLAAGMNDYLSKPVQMQDLADMIEKYIGLAREKINDK